MKAYFDQKVVVITGSSMGIGKSLAELLGSGNAKIVLNARNIDRLNATEKELKAQGFDVMSVAGDLTLENDCRKLINITIERFGKIDVLVNNAGISMRGNVSELMPNVISSVFNINAVAPLILSNLALPYIKASKGSIVFISSLAGLRGLPSLSVYCAAKMSLTAIAQSLRIEHFADDIHIGLIYVGITQIEEGKTAIGADGQPVNLSKRNGIFIKTSLQVAGIIADHIASGKKQTVIGLPGKLYFFLIRFFPGLAEFLMIRSQKKMSRHYK